LGYMRESRVLLDSEWKRLGLAIRSQTDLVGAGNGERSLLGPGAPQDHAVKDTRTRIAQVPREAVRPGLSQQWSRACRPPRRRLLRFCSLLVFFLLLLVGCGAGERPNYLSLVIENFDGDLFSRLLQVIVDHGFLHRAEGGARLKEMYSAASDVG